MGNPWMVRLGTCVARDERKVTLRSELWGRGGDSRGLPRCRQGSPPPSTSWAYFRKRAACQIMRRECCWCTQPFSFLLVQSERIQPGLFPDNSRLTSLSSGAASGSGNGGEICYLSFSFLLERLNRDSQLIRPRLCSFLWWFDANSQTGGPQTNAFEMTERELGKD